MLIIEEENNPDVEGCPLHRMTKAQLIEQLALARDRLSLLDTTEKIAGIGYYEWDYQSDCLKSCSEEYAWIFNMSVEQVMQSQDSWGKTLAQVHIGDQTRYKNAVEALPDTREIDVEFRVVLDNGQIRHLREIGVVTTDESGTGKGSFGVIQDLTNRVEHQREVAYRDALAQQAEAITDIGHFIYDELAEAYVYISPGYNFMPLSCH